MRAESPEDLLARFENFTECVILDVEFSHYQSILKVTLDYIWESRNVIRRGATPRKLVDVVFRQVQEVRIVNDLVNDLIEEPDEMSWGLNEVDWVSVEDDPDLLRNYQKFNHRFRHVRFARSPSERRIDVVFVHMEIHEDGQPSAFAEVLR